MQSSEETRDRPWPRKLTIERDRLHLLLEELGNIPREKFIGAVKYKDTNTWRGKPAAFIVAKLKDQELLVIKLKFDIKIEKMKRSPKFMFNTKTYHCE
jgi:hypothetical protein